MPSDREQIEAEVGGALHRLHPRAAITPLPPGDCIITEYCGGGGYGDPLLREPDLVAEDTRERRITVAAAERHWGVVLTPEATVDPQRTKERRDGLRDERRARWTIAGEFGQAGNELLIAGAGGMVDLSVGPSGAAIWTCSNCNASLGSASRSYRFTSARAESNPSELDPLLYPSPDLFGDPKIVLRQYFCPSCALMQSQEFCRSGDPVRDDVMIQGRDRPYETEQTT
jgi:N-methylhydantoinase B